MRKKICYILPLYDENTDTHYRYLYGFLERVSLELDVFLIIEKARGNPERFRTHARVYVQKSSFFPLRALEIFSVALISRARGYKDFYTHYSYLGALAGIFAGKFLGGRAFYWNCGMPWLYKTSSIRKAIFKIIMRMSIVVTGTGSLKNEYARVYRLHAGNIRILPNWIDVTETKSKLLSKTDARKALGIPEETFMILFVHRLSERKGAHKIVPIAERFLKEREALFFVIGDGPERGRLEESIKHRNLSEKIFLKGALPQKDIFPYYSAADILLMPSDEEGFPHVILEAEAAGLPYVASDVGGVRDIAPTEMRGYIVPKDSIEDFSRTLVAFSKKNAFSDFLKKHVEQYDIGNIVAIFTRLF